MGQKFTDTLGDTFSLHFKHAVSNHVIATGEFTGALNNALDEAVRIGQVRLYNGRQRSYPNVRGVTICTIDHKDTNGQWTTIHKAFAFCSSKDQFSRKRGRQVAYGRLLRHIGLPVQRENLLRQIPLSSV